MGPCTDGDVLPSREIGTSWVDDGERAFPQVRERAHAAGHAAGQSRLGWGAMMSRHLPHSWLKAPRCRRFLSSRTANNVCFREQMQLPFLKTISDNFLIWRDR